MERRKSPARKKIKELFRVNRANCQENEDKMKQLLKETEEIGERRKNK